MFQRGCWRTKYTSQCPSPQCSGYLQPCGQIYHIICAASRRPLSLQTQTLNLWVPPSLFRPPHCCRLGKPSADRFTVLSISWTQERVQPHRVTLQNYSPPLWKLNNLLYGTTVNAAVNVLLLLKEIWIGQLLWADSLQHSLPNDSVWWYMTKTDWTRGFKTSWELDFLSCSNHGGSVKTILFCISVFLCFPHIAFYAMMGNAEITCTVWVSCCKQISFFVIHILLYPSIVLTPCQVAQSLPLL